LHLALLRHFPSPAKRDYRQLARHTLLKIPQSEKVTYHDLAKDNAGIQPAFDETQSLVAGAIQRQPSHHDVSGAAGVLCCLWNRRFAPNGEIVLHVVPACDFVAIVGLSSSLQLSTALKMR
jgi:hypothetical protein